MKFYKILHWKKHICHLLNSIEFFEDLLLNHIRIALFFILFIQQSRTDNTIMTGTVHTFAMLVNFSNNLLQVFLFSSANLKRTLKST